MAISRIKGSNLVRVMIDVDGEIQVTHLPPDITLVLDNYVAKDVDLAIYGAGGDDVVKINPDPTGLSDGSDLYLRPPKSGIYTNAEGDEFQREIWEEL